MVELSKKHPCWLGEYALGFETQPFHVEWQDACKAHDRLVVEAPIEFGKSSQFTVCRPLWNLGENPDLRIAIISDTETKAKKWVSQIRTNIEVNPKVREVFPSLVPETRPGYTQAWSDEKFIVQRSDSAAFTHKEPSVQAFGVHGPLGGARFDIIILDDVLDFENTHTQASRERTWEWYRSPSGPLSRIVEGGSIWDIGTAWYEDDYRHEAARLPGYVKITYRANEGICRWPSRWSDARLAQRRKELGELEFARQFLNIAFGEATGYLPLANALRSQELCDDPIGWWDGGVPNEAMRWVTGGLDIGGSLQPGSSRAALTVLGYGVDGFKRPLHIRSGLWVGNLLFENVVQVWAMFEHILRELVVESNAQQIHLVSLLSNEAIVLAVAQSLGLEAERARRLATKIAVSTHGLYTTKQVHREDVKWGIRGMGPEIEAMKWRFPKGQPEIAELFADMRRYDPQGHPGDRLVSVYLANAKMLGKGKPVRGAAKSLSVRDLE
jgi:hypothetical protein